MGEGIVFATLQASLSTTSQITNLQSTNFSPLKASKMILAGVTIILLGFFGYTIGTRNSITLHSWMSF